jgi:hypothetical protein
VKPLNPQINEALENLAAAGTLRLRFVLDFKLLGFQFLGQSSVVDEQSDLPEATLLGNGSIQAEPEADELGEGSSSAALDSEYTAYGEPMYELNRAARPPRVGSTNSAVLTLLKHLPASFTRDQFEAVIPRAMRFDPSTGNFGVHTTFPTVKRAQQVYFAEFKKRGWVVPVRRGVTLTARLLDNDLVITCLSGLPGAHPPPSKPQRFEMLTMQLDNSQLSLSEKEAFEKALRANGTAEIFLPRHTSQFFAG